MRLDGSGQRLELLVVADIHGSQKGMEEIRRKISLHDPGALVICGDLTNFGPSGKAKAFVNGLDLMVMAVPGNCDTPEVLRALEESRAESLHRRAFSFGDHTFVGLGGSPRSPSGLEMEFSEERIFEFLDEVMTEGCILVTHAPAYGRNDSTRGAHLGSRSISSIVERYRPRLALSGHIHEARGVVREEGTVFLNPGPAKAGYAALVRIGRRDIEVDMLDAGDGRE